MQDKKKFNPTLFFWFVTAFVSGFVVLSLEMLGFRFLAPWFGYSTYVWGSLLGVIMAALSVGYYCGGVLVDRKPESTLLMDIILIATIYLALIALFYRNVLEVLSSCGIVWGSILGSIILFGPPMALLGTVSPFLIRLLAHEETVGAVTGKIFAVSTWGSLLGTFLTSFVLIPEFGSFKTLLGLTLVLSTLYLFGSLNKNWRILFGIGTLTFVFYLPGETLESGIVYQTESAYNLVKVRKNEDIYTLNLNGGPWTHSRYNKGMVSTGSYYDFMLIGPLLTKSKDLLILGAGAGTSIRQFLINFPEIHVDAVEIDPKVIAVGKHFFDWPQSQNLKIFIEDARPFLSHTQKLYNLIEVDVFNGGPFIPFYLSTKEFFGQIRQKLAPNGWLMMNVITEKNNRLFSDSMGSTILTVFPNLYILDLGNNMLLFAPTKATNYTVLKTILKNVPPSPLKVLSNYTLENIYEYHPTKKALVFTDDKAPTEKLIYDLLKNMSK
tara:strand:+ start:1045 stop:2526 length:1482 start_codon:yes stop_codon:yes gene_type:complete